MRNCLLFQIFRHTLPLIILTLVSACSEVEKAEIRPIKDNNDNPKSEQSQAGSELHGSIVFMTTSLLAQAIDLSINAEKSTLLDPCLRVDATPEGLERTFSVVALDNCKISPRGAWTGRLLITVKKTNCNCEENYFIHDIQLGTDNFGLKAVQRDNSKLNIEVDFITQSQIRQSAKNPKLWQHQTALKVTRSLYRYSKNEINGKLIYQGLSNLSIKGEFEFESEKNPDLSKGISAITDVKLVEELRDQKSNKINSSISLLGNELSSFDCSFRTQGKLNFKHEFNNSIKAPLGAFVVDLESNKNSIRNLNTKSRIELSGCKKPQEAYFSDLLKTTALLGKKHY